MQSSPHDNCQNIFLIRRPTIIFIKLGDSSMNIKHTKFCLFPLNWGETVRLCKSVEWDLAFKCSISIQLVYLKTTPSSRPGPVSNFQSMKSHVELIVFYWFFFVMLPILMRSNTGGLANETFLSKSYCFFQTIA